MVKYTSGPWTFLEMDDPEAEGNACRPFTICDKSDNDLASVFSSDDSTVGISREEAFGNAALMALAPRMFETLREVGAVMSADPETRKDDAKWALFSQVVAIIAAADWQK